MAFKLINATEVKTGTAIIIEGSPCIIRNQEVSKTGKHGHTKVRIEAVGILDDKKRVIAIPGTDRLEIPLIKKLRGQVLNIQGDKASIMDLETFETLDVMIDKEIKEMIKENDNVEYWDIDGAKIIKRKA